MIIMAHWAKAKEVLSVARKIASDNTRVECPDLGHTRYEHYSLIIDHTHSYSCTPFACVDSFLTVKAKFTVNNVNRGRIYTGRQQ